MASGRAGSPLKYALGLLVVILCAWGVLRVAGLLTMVNIWTAVEQEDLEAIQRYVDRGGDLEKGSFIRGKTPLLHALHLHKEKSYRKLLELGASPNTFCRGSNAPLDFAAAEEDSYWLRLALDAGGNPNLLNPSGGWPRTLPLVVAGNEGGLENVKLLLQRGANINAIDLYDRTPLSCACDHAKFEIVHYLLETGADYNTPTRMDHTFVYSLRQKHPESYRSDPNDGEKWCRAVWDWMIAHGADPHNATWDGTKWVFGQKNGNDKEEKR